MISASRVQDKIMSESPSKKHKKHKKHKHKKRRSDGEVEGDMSLDILGDIGDDEVDVVSTGHLPVEQPSGQPAIKLKIKIGGQSITQVTGSISSSVQIKEELKEEVSDLEMDMLDTKFPLQVQWEEDKVKGEDIFPTKKPGEDTSDEEREWLEALEAGTLDDSGAVSKKGKDESLLTSRQRALLHGQPEEMLLQLPSGYKTPEFTEEQLQRRQQRAKKRREQAFEKQEKDKKETLDRLLKKQDAKLKGGKGRGTSKRSQFPGFRYSSNATGDFISVPQGFQFPFPKQTYKPPPTRELCAADGCGNEKKYSCSKTGVPLCSLHCYKMNMSKVQSMKDLPVPVT